MTQERQQSDETLREQRDDLDGQPAARAEAEEESGPSETVLRRGIWVEIFGEFILLSVAGMLFVYIILDSRGIIGDEWPLSAAVMPWTAVAIGMPLLIARLVQVVRNALRTRAVLSQTDLKPRQRIMDVGFNVGADPKKEGQRFAMIIGAIALLYLGIWLVGFFITIPVWLMAYMVFIGKAKVRWALLTTAIIFAFTYFVYDQVLRVRWNNPLLFELF